MIKYNETYSFHRDAYCWHLHETKEGKDKDGNPKPSTKTTYHASLQQIAGQIIDREAGKCESLDQLIEFLTDVKEMLTDNLKGKSEVKNEQQ